MRKLFLLSPARVDGVRAGLLLNPNASFGLARQFQTTGLSLADVFTFASGLYFRGKIAYARRFAAEGDLVRVITTNAGLADPETRITPDTLRAFGAVDIHEAMRGTADLSAVTPRRSRADSARKASRCCSAASPLRNTVTC